MYIIGIIVLSSLSLFNIKHSVDEFAAFVPKASSSFLNRLQQPTFSIREEVPKKVKPRWKRRNRALISHIPHQVGDGLGHRYLMLNYEVMLSAELEVGYVHRRSRYGSLTPDSNILAVEKLFGFSGMNETRNTLIRENCETVAFFRDTCYGQNIQCMSLRKNSTFKRLVQIPNNITDCYIDLSNKQHAECTNRTKQFARKHHMDNTLFQTTPSRCNADYRSNNWKKSLAFLRSRYWDNRLKAKGSSPISLKSSSVSIAVHIRRGDFFEYNRTLIPDSVYASLICDVKASLDREVGASVATTVHIYSEGVAIGKVKDNHDIAKMYSIYKTENGTIAGYGHWTGLLKSICPSRISLPKIRLHIASDTIMSLHDMISADVFIGSRSGFSAHIVGNLARGIVFLPNEEGSPISGGTDGRMLKYSWYRNSSAAVIRYDRLDEKISEFAQLYKYELPLTGAILEGKIE